MSHPAPSLSTQHDHGSDQKPQRPQSSPRGGTRRRGDGATLMRTIVLVCLVVIVAFPLIALIPMGLRPEGLEVFQDSSVLEALRNSIFSATGSALAATFLGAVFAILLERCALPGGNTLRWMLMLPFLIPPFIGAMAWMALLGVNGPVNQLLDAFGIDQQLSIFGGWGVVFLLTIHSYPVAYLVISAALRQVPGNLEEAARISGASTWKVITTVTLPLMRPGIVAAFMLTLVSNLSDFGIPALIGLPERYTTLTTLVYRYINSATVANPLPAAASIGTLLLVIALVAITIQRSLPSSDQVSSSVAAEPFRLGVFRYVAAGLLWVWIAVACVIPMLALTSQALLPAPGVPFTRDNISLDNFITALTSRGAVQGIQNSVMLAGGAAIICMVLGLLVALLLTRFRHKLNPVIELGATLPQALPGVVIAVGWLLIAPRLGIFNTPWVILGAYVMAFLALVVQQVRAPLASISSSLEEAARISGASPQRAVLDITARLALPAVLTGGVVVFFTAVRELTISILLVAPGTQTLGVTIFNLQQAGNYNAAASLAVVVALAGIIGLSLAAWAGNRFSPANRK